MASLRIPQWRWLVVSILLFQQSGCGTIFWPERKGQPPGPLDLKVVALDAIGLLFFFIPGVIAFAVDFNNGTIYLPPGSYSKAGRAHDRWTGVHTGDARPTSNTIEEVVQFHTGKQIRLTPGSYRVAKLNSVDALEDVNLDQTQLAVDCVATDVRFRCQSE